MLSPKLLNNRIIFALIFLACLSSLAFALYMQLVEGMMPCPLCVFQRIALIVIAALSLSAFIHNPKKLASKIYSILVLLTSVAGLSVALRQSWLQGLPTADAPSCGPGIGYMFQNLPLKDFFMLIFNGSADCTKSVPFMGMTFADWSSIFFGIISITSFALIIFYRSNSKKCATK